MPETPRRDFLKLALGGAFAAASAALETAAWAAPEAPATPFSADALLDAARELAKSPFKAPNAALPDPFAKLTAEQYLAIRHNPNTAVWSDEKIGFTLEPLHRGFIFAAPVDIFIVENGEARRLIYDANAFDFGKLQPPADLPDIGFSGVRVLRADGDQGWTRRSRFFRARRFFAASPAARPMASTRAACRSAPAKRKARSFRCFARCGSRSRARRPTRWSSTLCSIRRA